jgi:hypothetical protein
MSPATGPVRGGYLVTAYPVLIPGGEDEAGFFLRGAYGATDRFDVRASLGFYNDLTYLGATGDLRLGRRGPVDLALSLGIHHGNFVEDSPDILGFDLTLVGSLDTPSIDYGQSELFESHVTHFDADAAALRERGAPRPAAAAGLRHCCPAHEDPRRNRRAAPDGRLVVVRSPLRCHADLRCLPEEIFGAARRRAVGRAAVGGAAPAGMSVNRGDASRLAGYDLPGLRAADPYEDTLATGNGWETPGRSGRVVWRFMRTRARAPWGFDQDSDRGIAVIPASRNRSTPSLLRTVVVSLLGTALSACGDSTSTAPPQPTPSFGHWLGAERIDGEPPDFPSCNAALGPVVATDANGGIVASWLSGCRIWAAVTGPGQDWSRPAELATILPDAAPNWMWEPTLAANSDGIGLVAWAAQDRTDGRQLFSRRFRPPAWSVVQRFDGGEAQQLASPYAASLALDGAGRGLAVWGSEGVVAARRSEADQWQTPERIGEGPSTVPLVFLDGAGHGFATWSQSGDAFARRFEPDHGWAETTRFASEAGWSFSGSGEVAFDTPSGEALLVWQRDESSTQTSSAWSASYVGGRWSTLGAISASGGRAAGPRVGVDADGRGMGVWNEQTVGPTFAVYERGAWGPPQLILAAPGAGPIALAVSTGGDAMVAWRETDAATGRGPVCGRRATRVALGGRASVQVSSNEPNDPAVSIDPCGNAVAIWSEFESGRARIWANRYETACP